MFESSHWLALGSFVVGYIGLWVFTWRYAPNNRPGKLVGPFSDPENGANVVKFAGRLSLGMFGLMLLIALFGDHSPDVLWRGGLAMIGHGIAYLHMRWLLLSSSRSSR